VADPNGLRIADLRRAQREVREALRRLRVAQARLRRLLEEA
jgi:hypothetical protein